MPSAYDCVASNNKTKRSQDRSPKRKVCSKQNYHRVGSLNAGSHDPMFGSNYYLNSKKLMPPPPWELMTRINISMNWKNAR